MAILITIIVAAVFLGASAEISLPPKATAADAWGFAIAKLKEGLISTGDEG